MMPSRIVDSFRVSGILLAFVLWAGAVPTADAALLISEVYYDHPGSDAGHEFLELVNPGPAPVSLDGWVLDWAGTSWASASLALSGMVPAMGYFLVGGAQTAADFGVIPDIVAGLTFQNGGSATDGVRVRHGSYTDTVLYDEPNTQGLTADPQWDGMSVAPDVVSGFALARVLQAFDTDAMSDFAEAVPTPMNSASRLPQSGGAGGTAPVPEPMSLLLVGLGVGWLYNRQDRRA